MSKNDDYYIHGMLEEILYLTEVNHEVTYQDLVKAIENNDEWFKEFSKNFVECFEKLASRIAEEREAV